VELAGYPAFTGMATPMTSDPLVSLLRRHNIGVEVWVDGSFLTEKINPEDVDVVLCAKHEIYARGTEEQKQILDKVSWNLKSELHCDSYIFFEFPEEHPLYERGRRARNYWLKQFVTSRSGEPKTADA
jgi:hypothetical protein